MSGRQASDLLAAEALRAVAAHRLGPAPTPVGALDDAAWAALVVACRRERLAGPLAFAIDDGTIAADDQQRAQAQQLHRSTMATVLRLERTLCELAPRLIDAGLDPVVVKGPAVARLDEPAPAMRSFVDVDLLVRGEELPRAVELVIGLGGRRRFEEPAAGYDRRFSKGSCVVLPSGVEVDLHRTLAPGPYGLLVDTASLHAGRVDLEIGGETLCALDAPRRFLHACYHAVLGDSPPRLVPLRDVVATCPTDPADAATARTLATAWRGEVVVAAALTTAAAVLGVAPPSGWMAWAGDVHRRPTDEVFLSAYRRPTRSSARQTALGLVAVPGAGARLAYARGHLLRLVRRR